MKIGRDVMITADVNRSSCIWVFTIEKFHSGSQRGVSKYLVCFVIVV